MGSTASPNRQAGRQAGGRAGGREQECGRGDAGGFNWWVGRAAGHSVQQRGVRACLTLPPSCSSQISSLQVHQL
jgi:hypothetical protein